MRRFFISTMVAVSGSVLPTTGFPACDVRSGPKTAALVELYTSEGCSSCPPADRQLSRLRQTLDSAAEVVPLALHVNYWDYIGWKDAYAQVVFGERQSWLVHANQQKTVYTPQFFVGGVDLRSRPGGLPEQVKQLNAQLATATIRVKAEPNTHGTLELSAEATAPAASFPASFYLAVTEDGLVSKVTRGENSGATLAHDHVMRVLIGPIRLEEGTARVQRHVALPAGWSRAQLEVIAFVQDERNGKVLQALRAMNCAGS
jgi:hypothetical protein